MAEVGTSMAIKDYNDAYVWSTAACCGRALTASAVAGTLRCVFYSALWARLRAGIDKGSSS